MMRSSGSNARHSRTPRLRFGRCLRQNALVLSLLPNSESRKTDCERRLLSSEASKSETSTDCADYADSEEKVSRSSRQDKEPVKNSTQGQVSSFLLLPAAPAPVSEIFVICRLCKDVQVNCD